jgi:hypothetical protein
MCACLAKVVALSQEVPGYIFEGFTQCLVVEFKEIHKLLNNSNRVCQMRAVSGKQDSNTTLEAVQKLCSNANDVFHSLYLKNKWEIPRGQWANAFRNVCYDCNTLDHTSNKCPLSRNEAKITKAKEACTKSVTKGCGSGGCGCGCGCGDGCGGRGGNRINTRGKWGTNKGDPATPSTNTSSSHGVETK